MWKKQRSLLRTKLSRRFNFIRLILIFVILSFYISTYFSINILTKEDFFLLAYNWLVIQITFTAIVIILLITLTFVLYRGFGPLTRIESTLDNVLNGNYMARVYVRKKDILLPLVEKINKILDLLQKTSNK